MDLDPHMGEPTLPTVRAIAQPALDTRHALSIRTAFHAHAARILRVICNGSKRPKPHALGFCPVSGFAGSHEILAVCSGFLLAHHVPIVEVTCPLAGQPSDGFHHGQGNERRVSIRPESYSTPLEKSIPLRGPHLKERVRIVPFVLAVDRGERIRVDVAPVAGCQRAPLALVGGIITAPAGLDRMHPIVEYPYLHHVARFPIRGTALCNDEDIFSLVDEEGIHWFLFRFRVQGY